MKIVFMGTPDFAKDSLEAIYESKHEICAVVTTPDKQQGRGMKTVYSPVKEYSVEKGLLVYQPEVIRKNEEFLSQIKALEPDVICVVAYGKILPTSFIRIPKYGCINVHPSLLPKYRGSTPIQTAILNGDKTTGVTIMYVDKGVDSGDIILKKEVTIGEDETTGELWNRLSKEGTNLLIRALEKMETNTVEREKQGDNYTTTSMLEKEMAKIDWEEKNASQIKNLVRALNPIMGAYTFWNDKKIKFWKVKVVSQEELVGKFPELIEYMYRLPDIEPGTVLFSSDKNGLYIKAKEDIIEVLEIQGENAKRMKIEDFLRGNKIDIGTIFK